MRCGTIDISQLKSPPEKSEFETAKYFAERGKNNEIDFLNVCAIISLKIRLDPLLHSGGPRVFFFCSVIRNILLQSRHFSVRKICLLVSCESFSLIISTITLDELHSRKGTLSFSNAVFGEYRSAVLIDMSLYLF